MKRIMMVLAAVLLCFALTATTVLADDAETRKLGTPTNLHWETETKTIELGTSNVDGKTYTSKEDVFPYFMTWDCVDPNVHLYEGAIYKGNGERASSISWSLDDDTLYNKFTIDDFLLRIDESGTYYFEIQAISIDSEVESSEIARSDTIEYTAPSDRLDTPQNVHAEGKTVVWDRLENADGYQIEYLGSQSGSTWWRSNDEDNSDCFYDTSEDEVEAGVYRYRVRALSNDISSIRNSEWSEYTDPVYIGTGGSSSSGGSGSPRQYGIITGVEHNVYADGDSFSVTMLEDGKEVKYSTVMNPDYNLRWHLSLAMMEINNEVFFVSFTTNNKKEIDAINFYLVFESTLDPSNHIDVINYEGLFYDAGNIDGFENYYSTPFSLSYYWLNDVIASATESDGLAIKIKGNDDYIHIPADSNITKLGWEEEGLAGKITFSKGLLSDIKVNDMVGLFKLDLNSNAWDTVFYMAYADAEKSKKYEGGKNIVLTPATKYVPYIHEGYAGYIIDPKGNWVVNHRAERERGRVKVIVAGELPPGLNIDERGVIQGIPTEAGRYTCRILCEDLNASFDGEYTATVIINVLENTNANVDVASDSDYEIITPVPKNIASGDYKDRVLLIDGEFSEFTDVFLDGRKLVRDLEYLAEEGSTRITILAQTFENAGEGTHTIAATFTHIDEESGVAEEKVVSQNYTVAKESSGGSRRSGGGSSFTNASSVIETMPVSEELVEENVPAMDESSFSDVDPSAWYFRAVEYVNEKGWMKGTDVNIFEPSGMATKEQIATVLWRISDSPEILSSHSFSDAKSGSWYESALSWASEYGIAEGSGGNFGIGLPVSREDLIVMIYRYAAYLGMDTSERAELTDFNDYENVSGYALDALSWAKEKGIINGTDENMLDPKGESTRAQIAAIMMRFGELME